MSTWHVTASLVATYASTGTFLAYVGVFRESGVASFSVQGGAQFIALALVIIGPLLWRYGKKFNSYTIPDFLGDRYGSEWVRGVTAVVIAFGFLIYVASVIIGGALIAQFVLGISYPIAVGAITLFFLVYTIRGGMLAVFVTDAIQFVTFMVGLILLAIVGVVAVGGFGNMISEIASTEPGWMKWNAVTSENPEGFPVFGLLTIWLIGQFVRPDLATRIYAARSEATVIKAAMFSAPILVLVTWLIFLISATSMIVLPTIPGGDPEQAFLFASLELLPPWLAAIPIVGVFAAALSTADTQLMVCSSAISRDFYEKLINRNASEAQVLRLARLAVLSTGLVAGAIALARPALITFIISFATLVFGAALFAPLIFGLFWKRGTREGALTAIISGTLLAVSSEALTLIDVQIFPSFLPPALGVLLVSSVLHVVVSLITQPTAAATSNYERIKATT